MTTCVAKTFLKFYVAQAMIGASIGFLIPWLKFAGVIH